MADLQFFDSDDLDDIEQASREIISGRVIGFQFVSGVTGGSTDQYTGITTSGTEELVWASGALDSFNVDSKLVTRGVVEPGDSAVSVNYRDVRGLDHVREILVDGVRYQISSRHEDRWGSKITSVYFVIVDPKAK